MGLTTAAVAVVALDTKRRFLLVLEPPTPLLLVATTLALTLISPAQAFAGVVREQLQAILERVEHTLVMAAVMAVLVVLEMAALVVFHTRQVAVAALEAILEMAAQALTQTTARRVIQVLLVLVAQVEAVVVAEIAERAKASRVQAAAVVWGFSAQVQAGQAVQVSLIRLVLAAFQTSRV
jgi:hypothetical protein